MGANLDLKSERVASPWSMIAAACTNPHPFIKLTDQQDPPELSSGVRGVFPYEAREKSDKGCFPRRKIKHI